MVKRIHAARPKNLRSPPSLWRHSTAWPRCSVLFEASGKAASCPCPDDCVRPDNALNSARVRDSGPSPNRINFDRHSSLAIEPNVPQRRSDSDFWWEAPWSSHRLPPAQTETMGRSQRRPGYPSGTDKILPRSRLASLGSWRNAVAARRRRQSQSTRASAGPRCGSG
jgi:hypothetical protein